MTIESDVLALFEEGNPVPDLNALDPAVLDAAAYLATLDQRSRNVTQLDTRRAEQRETRRSSLTWAIAAAAVIVLAIGLIVINRGIEEVPVVTEPTTTTITTPTSTTRAEGIRTDPRIDEGLAIATAFAQAQAILDESTLDELGSSDLTRRAGEAGFRDAVGWTDTVEDCIVSSSNPIGMSATCAIVQDTAFSRALGVDPVETEFSFSVVYEGETLSGQTMDRTRVVSTSESTMDWGRFSDEAWEPFVAWMEENHAEDLEVMFVDHIGSGRWQWGRGVPAFTDESNALWTQHTAEFVAAHQDQ